MITLKQLFALQCLARTGSFTRAAEDMAITQSAVSMMVKELEAQVGARLVQRGKVARLTPAGEVLRLSGAKAIEEVEQAVAAVRGEGRLKSGLIRVAVGHLTAATFFPQALRLFRQRQPQIAVEVLDGPVEQGSKLVINEEADVAVGSVDSHPSRMALLQAEELLRDPIYAVYGIDGGIDTASPGVIRWSELNGAELILVDRIYGQWRSLFLGMTEKGVEFRVAYEVKLYSTAIEMVRQGLGIALLPSYAAKRLDPAAFQIRRLEESPGDWVVHWVERRGAVPAPGLPELKKAVQEVLAEIR